MASGRLKGSGEETGGENQEMKGREHATGAKSPAGRCEAVKAKLGVGWQRVVSAGALSATPV